MERGGNQSTSPSTDIDLFDRLVEAQDQELALYGCVSPFTMTQLEAYAAGLPVPQIDLNAPGIREATERLLRGGRSRALDDDDDPDIATFDFEWGEWD